MVCAAVRTITCADHSALRNSCCASKRCCVVHRWPLKRKLLACGPLQLDIAARTATLAAQPVELSPTEFKRARNVAATQGTVVSRKALLSEVWDMGFVENATVLDTYVFYLRKKLHSDDFQPIQTVRGVGFRIQESV